MKHVVCYSGGHSSGIVAIEVVRRYGKENVILLNHDINANVEEADIKRFKKEVADFLGVPITYKNYQDLPVDLLPDQFEVVEIEKSFLSPQTRQALCTSRLKTVPFTEYLSHTFPNKDCVIYYGFDISEPNRVERREEILSSMGYTSDYPLVLWAYEGIDAYNDMVIKGLMDTVNNINTVKYKSVEKFKKEQSVLVELAINSGALQLKTYDTVFPRTLIKTQEVGILPPQTYGVFKHANCTGCLKAGQQHWYCVYVHRPDIFERAKLSEERIGYSIISGYFLKDLESKFEKMKCAGIEANEHVPFQTFWAKARKFLKKLEEDYKPCECSVN